MDLLIAIVCNVGSIRTKDEVNPQIRIASSFGRDRYFYVFAAMNETSCSSTCQAPRLPSRRDGTTRGADEGATRARFEC